MKIWTRFALLIGGTTCAALGLLAVTVPAPQATATAAAPEVVSPTPLNIEWP
ncbi:hypothetical protein N4G70_13895 [Streptomyces sp. ASQP_92]|uniref:hypothetical protein n=1 Tax=Streptomyces sp. ASQP_92 TaxID=2979116 RepID=UPI0021C1A04C|nr:hypothetical protein [Streptomyces sp. ASQP_92]MCT9089956.1 hypothetical protein [Streptomyces sp. ASQP_92]